MLGGVLYLTGALIMVWNLYKTVTMVESEEPQALPSGAIAAAAE